MLLLTLLKERHNAKHLNSQTSLKIYDDNFVHFCLAQIQNMPVHNHTFYLGIWSSPYNVYCFAWGTFLWLYILFCNVFYCCSMNQLVQFKISGLGGRPTTFYNNSATAWNMLTSNNVFQRKHLGQNFHFSFQS